MGNFNVYLFFYYTTDTSTAHFLDQVHSSSLIPQMISPTRISTKSKTLIDNIFSTDIFSTRTHLGKHNYIYI